MTETETIYSALGLSKFGHAFGRLSDANLEGVYPPIVGVARLAVTISSFDGTVISGGGLRTLAQAENNVARGTGILDSRHRVKSDGFGHAIDVIALTDGRINWENLAGFKEVARSVRIAAAWLAVPIRQGCDFKQTGVMGSSHDWAHFEDPDEEHLARAVEMMNDYRRELGLGDTERIPGASIPCPHCGGAVSLSAGVWNAHS